MEEPSLIPMINHALDLALPPGLPFAEMRKRIHAEISRLITSGFQQLVNILYRVDVNERKLKYLLQENIGEDAAVIIGDLIIARQFEKIAARKTFTSTGDGIADDDKW